jgi:hypothetical protein
MNDGDILKRFCGEGLPMWLEEPFVVRTRDGELFTVATDGHAIVRFPGIHAGPPTYPEKYKPNIDVLSALDWDILKRGRKFRVRLAMLL